MVGGGFGVRSYCTFENRKSAFIAVKLLVLSVERHCRNFVFYIAVTEEEPELEAWLKRHAPHAVLIRLEPFMRGKSLKHVKAVLILELFRRGLTDVTWLDTDLLVLRDLESLLETVPDDTVLVSQEDTGYPFEFNERLLSHYGLKPARELATHVNSCVIRVTTQHRALIERYLACLLDPLFVDQQSKSLAEKIHDFAFEQGILEMLLCSGSDSWQHNWPVEFIPQGPGIVQELGVTTYRLRNRLRNGLGIRKPWFVHVPGVAKPWNLDARSRSYRAASVYSAFANKYRNQVEEDMSWVNSAGISSRIARLLSFGQPHWVGWGHCFAGKAWRLLRTGTTRRDLHTDRPRVPVNDEPKRNLATSQV